MSAHDEGFGGNGNGLNGNGLYGLAAEFPSGQDLLRAAGAVRRAGYTKFDTFSPLPIHGMEDAVGQRYTLLPWVVFVAAVAGGALGFGLQYWTSVIDYPLVIGGKPLNSWPAFIPITFECTILFAGLTSAIAMVLMNGLPRPYHPMFNTPRFERATVDRFFLCIEAEDPMFDRDATRAFLEEHNPDAVSDVHY
ncbi:MAG: DUF3341 domain-containing protein [Myxococcota bacterium]